MFKTYLSFLLFSLFNIGAWAQNVNLEWVNPKFSNLYSSVRVSKIDNNNNIISLGHFSDTLFVNPELGDSIHVSQGGTDVFFQKTTSDGSVLWVKTMGSVGYDLIRNLVVDNNGDFYISGTFNDSLDLDMGSGEHILVPNEDLGDEHFFIAKYNNDGNFIWVKEFTSDYWFQYRSHLQVDNQGNVYSIGNFRGIINFDVNGSNISLDANDLYDDLYIMKLNPQGDLIWVKQIEFEEFGGFDFSTPHIEVTDSEEIFIMGDFVGVVDFDPDATAVYNMDAGISKDVFILKLDAEGDFIWAKQIEGVVNNIDGEAFALDQNENIVIAGLYSIGADFDPSSNVEIVETDSFNGTYIVNLTSDGEFNWVKTIDMYGGVFTQEYTLDVDAANNIYLTGSYTRRIQVPMDGDTLIINNIDTAGSYDVYLWKLDASGNVRWFETYGGYANDFSLDVAVDDLGEIYVSGQFNMTADFDPDTTVYEVSPVGTTNGFLQKLNQCMTVSIDSQIVCDSIVWIDGNVYQEGGQTVSYTFTDEFGCDSVIVLDLEVVEVNTTIVPFGPSLMVQQSGASYQWLDCDDGFSEIPMATLQNFIPPTYGNYAVEIEHNGCVTLSDCYTYDVFSSPEEVFNDVNIYPNPTTNIITIELGELNDIGIVVSDILGHEVYNQIHSSGSKHHIELPNSNGIYIVELKSAFATRQFKILKQE